jgi:AcrR family transcriptional regulator
MTNSFAVRTDRFCDSGGMALPTGRREASKRATRAALQRAADRLFAEQGYAATTVREIADAAGVTERTFFRYFTGKEELIIDEALGWLPVLYERVRRRPAAEDPVTALRMAMIELRETLAVSSRPTPLWLFADGPPAARGARPAPGLVLKIEAGLADVLGERLAATGRDYGMDRRYLAEVLARAALAAIRSAFIRDWQLRQAGAADRPSASDLVDQAFALLRLPAPVA